MTIDRKKFYDKVRINLFNGKLNTNQVEGMTAILDEWEKRGLTDLRELAYMLATPYHETAFTMQPVRETRASTDDAAIGILDRAFANGKLPWVKKPYWRKDANGKSWLGRGLVQLTHKENYDTMSAIVGVDLVARPERAMEMPIAIAIMFEGMRRGSFTGAKLETYFPGNGGQADWVNARKIINGLDRAEDIARYGKTFYSALA